MWCPTSIIADAMAIRRVPCAIIDWPHWNCLECVRQQSLPRRLPRVPQSTTQMVRSLPQLLRPVHNNLDGKLPCSNFLPTWLKCFRLES
jgi:hypothetical protein